MSNHNEHISRDLIAALAPGIALLAKAAQYAGDSAHDTWDFAVSIQHLYRLGLDETDLRWLACKGFVQHAREVSANGSRAFETAGTLTFYEDSCFVLTELGRTLTVVPEHAGATASIHTEPSQPSPFWDAEERKLWLGNTLVKAFRHAAPNQELVLTAFQKRHWIHRIDDPLPMLAGIDAKQRLHDTIKTLNRSCHSSRLEFYGDGGGHGICWRLVTLRKDRRQK